MQVKVCGTFAALCVIDSDVDTLAKRLKDGLLSTIEEVVERLWKKNEPWITNEVLDLCDQRRQPKQQKYTSTEAGLKYRKVNREVRKKMKTAKEEWIDEQCKNTEKGMIFRNSKEAYNTFKAHNNISQQSSKPAVETSGQKVQLF